MTNEQIAFASHAAVGRVVENGRAYVSRGAVVQEVVDMLIELEIAHTVTARINGGGWWITSGK